MLLNHSAMNVHSGTPLPVGSGEWLGHGIVLFGQNNLITQSNNRTNAGCYPPPQIISIEVKKLSRQLFWLCG